MPLLHNHSGSAPPSLPNLKMTAATGNQDRNGQTSAQSLTTQRIGDFEASGHEKSSGSGISEETSMGHKGA